MADPKTLTLALWAAPLLLCQVLSAQTPVPAHFAPLAADLPDSTWSPFDGTSRSQQFLTAKALGARPGKVITVREVLFRYDGPTTGGPLAHVLASVELRLGTTARTPYEIGAVFDDNLTQSLTTVFSATSFQVKPDANATNQAQAFGDGSNLLLRLPTPYQLTVPSSGCVVAELRVEAAAGHTPGTSQLDFAETTAPSAGYGMSYAGGVSCSYPLYDAGPKLFTDGGVDIGTSFSLSGDTFPANAPVITWLTSGLTPPLLIPGTNACWSYLDFNTGDTLFLHMADAAGVLGGGDPPVPIPPTPGLCGSLLYFQSAALTTPTAMNVIGVETSNYRTILIGCRSQSDIEGWYVMRRGSSTAEVAELSLGGGLAMLMR